MNEIPRKPKKDKKELDVSLDLNIKLDMDKYMSFKG